MLRKDINSLQRIAKESRGFSPKFWVFDGIKKLIKYNTKLYHDGDLMEMLSSEILDILHIKHVNIELGFDNNQKRLQQINAANQNCSIIDTYMIEEGDISFELIKNLPKTSSNSTKKQIRNKLYGIKKTFQDLPGNNSQTTTQMFKDYLEIILGDCIIGNIDRTMKNIGIIYNEKHRKYRLAPSFDNALAFHSYTMKSQKPYVCIGNQYYSADEVLKFIINNYSENVEEVLNHIPDLEKDKDNILNKYINEIEPEKLDFINDSLTTTIKKLK